MPPTMSPAPMAPPTPSAKHPMHGVIIALAILNTVGLLLMFFKLNMVDTSLSNAQKQMYSEMEEMNGKMMAPVAQTPEVPKNTPPSEPQPALFPYGTYAFLKPGQMVWIGATHGEVTGEASKIGEL